MNRTLIIRSFIFLCFLMLASCGGDNTTGPKASSDTSSLVGGTQCGCNTSGIPVCGINTSGNQIDYPNSCVSSCYKATSVVQGHCNCSYGTRVCGVDGVDYNECDAQSYRVTIKNYGTCAAPVTQY